MSTICKMLKLLQTHIMHRFQCAWKPTSKMNLPLPQRTISFLCCYHREIDGVLYPTSSSAFSPPIGPSWPTTYLTIRKNALPKKASFKWRNNCWNKCLFQRIGSILLVGRDQQMEPEKVAPEQTCILLAIRGCSSMSLYWLFNKVDISQKKQEMKSQSGKNNMALRDKNNNETTKKTYLVKEKAPRLKNLHYVRLVQLKQLH